MVVIFIVLGNLHAVSSYGSLLYAKVILSQLTNDPVCQLCRMCRLAYNVP